MTPTTRPEESQEDAPSHADRDDELLVAYLDGELEPAVKRSLEERLAAEPDLRRKVAELESSWNALSFLERERTDRGLVFSTMELIVAKTEDEAKTLTRNRPAAFFRRSLVHAGLSLLCVVAGYVAFSAIYRVDEENIYEDLTIVDRMDQYMLLEEIRHANIDEIEFLRELREARILD